MPAIRLSLRPSLVHPSCESVGGGELRLRPLLRSRSSPSSSQSRPAAEASIEDPPRCDTCLVVGLPERELPNFTANVAGFPLPKALLQLGLKEVRALNTKEKGGTQAGCALEEVAGGEGYLWIQKVHVNEH